MEKISKKIKLSKHKYSLSTPGLNLLKNNSYFYYYYYILNYNFFLGNTAQPNILLNNPVLVKFFNFFNFKFDDFFYYGCSNISVNILLIDNKISFYSLKSIKILFNKSNFISNKIRKVFFKKFISIKTNKQTLLHTYCSNIDYFFKNVNFFKKLTAPKKNNPISISKLFLKNFFFFRFFKNDLLNSNNHSTHAFNSYFYNSFFDLNSYNGFENSFSSNFNTNFTPSFFFKNSIQNLINRKLTNNYVPGFYKYIYYSVSSFLESTLKKRVFLKISSKYQSDFKLKEEFNSIFLKNKSLQSRVGRGFFLSEMLDIIYSSFFFKDLNILIK